MWCCWVPGGCPGCLFVVVPPGRGFCIRGVGGLARCRGLGQCALWPGRLLLFLFWGVGVVWVWLVVNCIVDASIFVLCFVVLFVFWSVRWMPWHQGPMKDVVACDIPRGAG